MSPHSNIVQDSHPRHKCKSILTAIDSKTFSQMPIAEARYHKKPYYRCQIYMSTHDQQPRLKGMFYVIIDSMTSANSTLQGHFIDHDHNIYRPLLRH